MTRSYFSSIVVLLFLFPSFAYASDFTVLAVLLGALIISGGNIVLGLIASNRAYKGSLNDSVPYMVIIGVLMFIGFGMVMGEADHMSDGDTNGMRAMVIISGLIGMALPIVTKVIKLR
jgi:hypothetical protein